MINWIRRHKVFSIIVAVVLALCIVISISYFSGTGFVGNLIQRGNTAVSEPLSDASDGVKSGIRGIFGFKALMTENEELKAEIEALNKEIVSIKLKERELQELRELSNALNYESVAGTYIPVTGDVVAMDNSGVFTTFTINVGEESGIKKDAVVIAGNGLVGRVSETGKGYSKVVSLIYESVNVSFQVLRDMDILGVVYGDGKGNLTGFTLDGEVGIVEGDMLVTTGIGMYPEGIEIGQVTAVEYNSDTKLMSVYAEPVVDFKNIRKVMVLI